MIANKKKLALISMLVILFTVMACSAVYSVFPGIGDPRGESIDADHTRWIDVPDQVTDNADEPAADPDSIQGESQSGADSSTRPEVTDNVGNDPSLQNTELVRRVYSGDTTIDLIEPQGSGTQGQLLEVVITNHSGEEISFEIPAGLVFAPEDEGDQDLMVLDAVVVELDPGETITFEPYVICIESSDSAPSQTSVYTIDRMETGELLNFADCVDQEGDGHLSADDFGLQFAVWRVADGDDFLQISELPEDPTGAMGDIMENWESTGMLEAMQNMWQMYSQEWLDRCQISSENGD